MDMMFWQVLQVCSCASSTCAVSTYSPCRQHCRPLPWDCQQPVTTQAPGAQAALTSAADGLEALKWPCLQASRHRQHNRLTQLGTRRAVHGDHPVPLAQQGATDKPEPSNPCRLVRGGPAHPTGADTRRSVRHDRLTATKPARHHRHSLCVQFSMLGVPSSLHAKAWTHKMRLGAHLHLLSAALLEPPIPQRAPTCTRSSIVGVARPVLMVEKLRCTLSRDFSNFSICSSIGGWSCLM